MAPDTKEYSMPYHEITTDKSFANINAITGALNLKTLPQYLEECYNILQQTNSSSRTLDGLVVIRLCSSHTTKTIRDDVRKHFTEHEFYVCRLIGTMFNLKTFSDLEEYIKSVIIIFMSPTKGITFLYALAVVDSASGAQVQPAVPHELDNQEHQFPANDEARKLHKAIYKNSQFFQLFSSYADTLAFDDELDDEVNELFCPEFVRRFLKNHISYLPL